MTAPHINQYTRLRELYITGAYKAKLIIKKGAFSLALYKCINIPLLGKIGYGKAEVIVPISVSQLGFAEAMYHSCFKTKVFGREDKIRWSEYSAYVMHGFMENATHGPMDLMHALIGMSGELGEVQEAVKKHIFHGKEYDRIKLVEEFGDFIWYSTAFMSLMGISLIDVLVANKTKLDQRYKDGRRDLMYRNPTLEYKLMTEKLKEKVVIPPLDEKGVKSDGDYTDTPGHLGVMATDDQLGDEGRRLHFREGEV